MKYLLLLLISFSALAADPSIEPQSRIWADPPTHREDASALPTSEIGGYKLYCGTTTKDYQTEYDLAKSEFIFNNADYPAGTTLYCVFTTIDTQGRESLYSNEVAHTIEVMIAAPKPPTAHGPEPYDALGGNGLSK